ncbi:MAG TPA: LysR family transcriptional regulator [Parvibaculum sp.]|uniref:LysR family transcriptional regulator n=1 Tax=Parvibaculum sp. TaxID=2024848 RepID=UPI002C297489|nr:LysR family transcriptional regulator [Parvibaculum sp.]HMM13907.1 LysR family transcriptional regulator [Parvibaculum sp.]
MKLQKRMPFDWEDLRLFLETTRHPTLADAALRLRIDPTTLGRRLKRFEQEIGTNLFERAQQGLRLTPTGQRLASYVERMEDSSLQALEAIKGISGTVRGTVRISTTEGFGTFVVAPALVDLAREHPDIDIDLVASSGFLSVSKREADIAILLARPQTGRLFTQKLADYALMLYASKRYLRGAPPIRTAQDLARHRLVGYVDDLIYSPKLRYLDELPVAVSPSIKSSSIVGQYHATKAGAGLCILPCFIADQDKSLVRVLPDEFRIERSFWLAVHEDIRGFARIRAVLDALIGAAHARQALLMGRLD